MKKTEFKRRLSQADINDGDGDAAPTPLTPDEARARIEAIAIEFVAAGHAHPAALLSIKQKGRPN